MDKPASFCMSRDSYVIMALARARQFCRIVMNARQYTYVLSSASTFLLCV
jgi:hypothetical protein